MFRNWSITWRLSISMLAVSALVLTAVIGYGYFVARQILEQELEAKAWQLARATTGRIQTVEAAVRKLTDGVDTSLEVQALTNPEQLYRLLDRLVNDHKEVFGAAVALEPGMLGTDRSLMAPYVFRSASWPAHDNLALHSTPYVVQDWYSLPKMLGYPVWSEPYRSESARNTLMVTYSAPLNDAGGKFFGVVRCDVSLAWISDLLQSLPLGQGGYAFIVSANGTYIAHPVPGMILKENIFSMAETEKNSALRDVGRKMVRGESGFIPYSSIQAGKSGWLIYQPVAGTGWSLGIYFSEEELTGKVAELSRKEGMIALAGFLLMLPIILLVAGTITGPLRKLAEATKVLAAGDLEAALPEIPGQDEAARLAGAFAKMRDELRQHMALLAEAATAKERMESELRIARSIQMELVPKTFPPFPHRKDFSLYATMVPAREVGGDFYDFMMPDEEHLWIAIGDVSGKGIPAAMFMAVTRTFLRAFVQEEKSPGKVMHRLNNELARNNDASMFVTLFCGVLHLPTGKFCWANGGHNLPFLMQTDSAVGFLPRTKGTMLGAMEEMVYVEETLQLEPGETLFLYTDGVTEAMNADDQLLGNEETRLALVGLCGKNSREIVSGVNDAVNAFVSGAEQSDDITMLALQYYGLEIKKTPG